MTTREAKHTVRLREWGQMVKLCQESGLTVTEWCAQNGIKPACYYYRLAQVRKALLNQSHPVSSIDQGPTVPTLVKVNIAPAEQHLSSVPEVAGEHYFRLRYSTAVLEIPVGTVAGDIAEVLKAMGQYDF